MITATRPARTLEQKRALASRVILGGYYTDGQDLYATEAFGATGCVMFRAGRDGASLRCLSIEDFRARMWLVKERA